MVPKETKCIIGNAKVANGENVLLISATISCPRFSPALSPKREGRSRLLPPLLFALPFCKYCLTTKQIHLTPKICYVEDEELITFKPRLREEHQCSRGKTFRQKVLFDFVYLFSRSLIYETVQQNLLRTLC